MNELKTKAMIHTHSSELMPEIKDSSVRLFIGGGLYCGRGSGWEPYRDIYRQVYVQEGLRVIRQDGIMLTIQSNAYDQGNLFCRYALLYDLMTSSGFQVIDERVWIRKKCDLFQVPFSHVHVWRPPDGTATRARINKKSNKNGWFVGAWNYPQAKGKTLNSFPGEMCRMIIEATTDPGDIVLDPLAGNAVMLREAADMSREAIGYEIDKNILRDMNRDIFDVTNSK